MKLLALALFALLGLAASTKLILINNSHIIPGNTTYVCRKKARLIMLTQMPVS